MSMTPSNPSVEAWWQRIVADDLLPRPQGPMLDLWQALEREDADLAELARLAQGDPTLASRLLKLANSSVYAGQRPAAAVSADVLMRLGLSTVRQLLLGFVLVDGLRAGRCEHFSLPHFWRQALCTAVLAQHLGARLRLAPPSECFTLGLLFDLGTVLLVESDETACRLIGDAAPPRARLRAHYGLSPLRLTARLMQSLGLPAVFVEAVSHCAGAEEGQAPASGARALQIARMLALAERLALGLAGEGVPPAPEEFATELAALALAAEELPVLVQRAGEEWRDWCDLFGLAAAPLPARQPLPMTAARESLTLVVIDDDPVLRRLVEKLLAAPERHIHTFASGAEALAWLAAHPADAALVDLLLPGEDGWRLIEALRALPGGERLHIIVLSALGDNASVARAFAAGADDYLVKPFDALMVETRLTPALRKKRTGAQPIIPRPPLIDGATGLLNRAYLESRLEQELALAHRLGRPLTLLGLRFARPGELLARIGRLRQGLRASDIHGLWDAQSLWLLLPATDEEGVPPMLERLRAPLANPGRADEVLPAVFRLTVGRAEIAAAPPTSGDDWAERARALLERFAAQPATPYPGPDSSNSRWQ
jgi:DNA-binding response OmpR family regulator/HD-like signal output (HDOD) protein